MLILLSHHIIDAAATTYLYIYYSYKVKQPQMSYKYNSATHNNNVLKQM